MAETELLDSKSTGILFKIFGYAMFIAYPLVFHDYYFDIVTCKYIFLIVMSVYLFAAFIMTKEKIHTNDIVNEGIVILMLILGILSAFCSDYTEDVINGVDGRNNGIITLAIYTLIYIVFSRVGFNHKTLFYIVTIGSIPVAVLGILNFLSIDFLGFYEEIDSSYQQFYISTLGHVNVYSGYFSITIPIMLIYFFKTRNIKEKIFFFAGTVINMTGLLCGMCDSSAIIIFAAVICAVILNKKLHAHYWLMLAANVLAVNKVLILLNNENSVKKQLCKSQQLLGNNRIIIIVLSGLAVITALEILFKKLNRDNFDMIKILKWLIVEILLFMVCFLILNMFYFTFINKDANLGGWERILRFNEEFGNYRGYIWKITAKEYLRLPIIKKLIGIGPDALLSFLSDRYGYTLYKVTNAFYDNAHNEFLQYLITMGIVWLLLYVILIVRKIKKAFCKSAQEYDKIIACAVICYLLSSMVNINQVVTGPLFVFMLSVLNSEENV